MTTPTLEALRGTTGLWTMTLDTQPVEQLRAIVAELDELRFSALWLPEAWGREALVNASLALGASTTGSIQPTGQPHHASRPRSASSTVIAWVGNSPATHPTG